MNMLRKILFFGLMTVAGTVFGQNRNTADKVDRPNTKKINFGVRAGFNSSMFMVSELKIKDVTIDEVQNNYKIGYFGALFFTCFSSSSFRSRSSCLMLHNFVSILLISNNLNPPCLAIYKLSVS